MEKKYTKLLEVLRSTAEFAQDYSNMQRCEKNVNTYDRMAAWACLQDVIHEYRCQINEFGLLFDGIHVEWNVDFNKRSDDEIKRDLTYLAAHIPIYVLLREGEKALAKQVGKWLEQTSKTKM